MQTLAIDLAKQSFHGVDAEGEVISRRVGRAKLVGLVDRLGPAAMAIEACATAHHWARVFLAAGCEVRLLNPRFVTPDVEGLPRTTRSTPRPSSRGFAPDDALRAGEETGRQDLQSLRLGSGTGRSRSGRT